ncbi:MAG: hypothetical protein JO250_21560, partial [Armatimonadetes bacterium]|nr:hypothetical protein [Armatimonadota bacterium]
ISSSSGAPSLRAAVAQVIAALDAPISRQDLVDRVLALHPSQARRPADRVLAEVRQHTDLVRLEDGRFAPPDWILRGVRFRHVPTPIDSANGIVPIFPCFVPFLLERDAAGGPGAPPLLTLRDQATGAEIAWEPFDLHGSLLLDGPGENAIHFQALNLRPWFHRHQFAPGDSLMLTIEDPRRAIFRLGYEAAADADRAGIAVQDATMEAVLTALVEKSTSEQPFIEEIIPAALARLHEAARRYPGSHWYTVVTRSPRLRPVDDYAIARATFRRPIDRLFGYAASPASERNLEARVEAYNADQARILEVTREEDRPDTPRPVPCSAETALRQSMRQIAAFLAQEGQEPATEDRYRCLAVPSVYLAKHEGVSLADADYPMLCRFLLSYYPRRVLFNRKAFTARMLASLRRFYEQCGQPERAGLPPRLSRLHGLVDRKIALMNELSLDSPQSARLFARLFPQADKVDAEVLTLTFRETPPRA